MQSNYVCHQHPWADNVNSDFHGSLGTVHGSTGHLIFTLVLYIYKTSVPLAMSLYIMYFLLYPIASTGHYDLIVVDPPWENHSTIRGKK